MFEAAVAIAEERAAKQHARDQFLTTGIIASGLIEPYVMNSWQRAKERRVGPDRLNSQRQRDVNAETPLTRAAIPVLDRLTEDMALHAVGIILTSADGLVLERKVTDQAILRTLDEVQLARGYSYAEEFTGTNGIGTSLECGRPTFIRGSEHYVGALTELACAGTPIRDPVTGRVLGVVNLTCWVGESDPMQFTLAKNVGSQIEGRLGALKTEAEVALLSAYRQQTRRHPGHVMAVGGDIVLMNQCLRQTLGSADQIALLGNAAEMIQTADGATALAFLPSGSVARLSTVERIAPASAVFQVQIQSTAERSVAVRPSRHIPGLAGHSSSWRRCEQLVEQCCRDRNWVVIEGERGSGRAKLGQAVAQFVSPQRSVRVLRVEKFSSAEDFVAEVEAQTADDDFALVLANVDDLPESAVEQLAAILQAQAGHGWIAVTTDVQVRSPLLHMLVVPHFTHTAVVPPLRHRIDDIEDLVPMLLRELTRGADVRLAPDAMRQLTKLAWPGNVAQLRKVLTETVAVQRSGIIGVDKLPAECRSLARHRLTALEALERDAIVRSLIESGGDKAAAASALGMSRATIYRKINQFGIS
ncbi:sigma-54-dependent Fis family transcriptional regulator [[Mycobacterium] nativiensis]|uniref:Helix-turn-helix domain-containing protein n=1 Tax=[Mycobacterium] nativiensis TaxID=2855503 RepID=A0ABU5XSU1_9MYCO|nr:helix-turn-helix domain-containing protein [Mycolicibacter sp. MYC340]MEB3031049.1 helix-turn-helix domain-containing protein [Mycolicibacter sp. MYC340]